MSDKNVILNIDRKTFGISESDSKFEKLITESANKLLEDRGMTPSNFHLSDVGVEGDDYIVVMAFDGERTDPEVVEESPVETVEEVVAETPKIDKHSIDPEAHSDSSVAYSGPWADKKFELDVVEMSALFDLVQFAVMVMTPQNQGGLGFITETSLRSASVVNSFCIENVSGEVSTDERGNPVFNMAPEFQEHYSAWVNESYSLFMAEKEKRQSRIVKGGMMPGANFNPKGERSLEDMIR